MGGKNGASAADLPTTICELWASSGGSGMPSSAGGIDVGKEQEQLQLLSLFTGNNDNLLRLLLLCRQYGDAATSAALEAASAVASEEANLTETAREIEKKKRQEHLQATKAAEKAEEERTLLVTEADNFAEQAAKKLEAAKAAAAARNDAAKAAAEAAEAAETAEAVRLRTIASTGGELPQLDGVMILGHIGMNA